MQKKEAWKQTLRQTCMCTPNPHTYTHTHTILYIVATLLSLQRRLRPCCIPSQRPILSYFLLSLSFLLLCQLQVGLRQLSFQSFHVFVSTTTLSSGSGLSGSGPVQVDGQRKKEAGLQTHTPSPCCHLFGSHKNGHCKREGYPPHRCKSASSLAISCSVGEPDP